MTGGDQITARFLYQENFSFKPELKLWLAANHKPQIRGTDFAIWRRVRLIPFTKTFTPEERDKTIKARLLAELPGILAWCVRGAQRWLEEGLEPPEAVVAATDEYRMEQDVIGEWLHECCVQGSHLRDQAGVLFESFTTWSRDKHLTQNAFGRKLTERGFIKAKDEVTRRTVWKGLRIVNSDGNTSE